MSDSNGHDPQDVKLQALMTALDPDPEQVRRMEQAVMSALAAQRPSLVQEWIDLLWVRPLLHPGLAMAAACLLLLTTPLGLIPLSLLGK